MVKSTIPFSDFAKLDLRVGEIKEAAEVEGSSKLLKLTVDFGPAPDGAGLKTIYAGIKPWYLPENLVGRKLGFVVNLEGKKFVINGVDHESSGMLLAAGEGEAVIHTFDKDLAPGTSLH